MAFCSLVTGEVTRQAEGLCSVRTAISSASQDVVRANYDVDHAASFDVFYSSVSDNSRAPTNVTARVSPFREMDSMKSS